MKWAFIKSQGRWKKKTENLKILRSDTEGVAKPSVHHQINPFVPNAPFLYRLKTSENLTVFSYFQRVEKGCIGNELVNWTKIQT